MFLGTDEASNTPNICKLFRRHFLSVFSNDSLNTTEIERAVSNVPLHSPVGSFHIITKEDIKTACLKLKSSATSGPDGIPSVMLKNCCDAVSLPLELIFNLSLKTGVFPECWKNSYIFPVYKKGDKKNIANYRGIAALSATSKLFELLVLDFLRHNLSHYFFDAQHGFIPKRSVNTNLLSYTSFLFNSLQDGYQIDAIYTDLSAAFDKINHQIAIAKLGRLGVSGSLLAWIASYLMGRSMSVKIGDNTSSQLLVTSGAPQGSHLGPFIFLLYFNDAMYSLKCNHLSYADDLKLFYKVKNEFDCGFLQDQINAFSNWCALNKMVLNASKCSVISFSRKRQTLIYSYDINNVTIKRESTIKDLGIIFDTQLSFKDHISHIVSKASRMLGFIFRIAKSFTDVYCLKALYCALVRSILEYGSVVWAPYYQNSITRIEAIQHKFIRFALRHLRWNDPLNLPPYESRCRLIDLDTLSFRRDVAKAVFVADLITAKVDCAPLLSLLNFNVYYRNLRSHAFFRIPRARTNYGFNEPVSSMCRVFNRCSHVFDYNLSRASLRKRFTSCLFSQ